MSFYTCYLLMVTAGNDMDYTDTIYKYFGRRGWVIGMILFIMNLFIPIFLYFQILAQNLYPIILAIMGSDRPIDVDPDFSEFSYSYSCIIILGVLMIMTSFRNLSFIVKFSSFSVAFVLLIITFITTIGCYSFSNTTFIVSDQKPPVVPENDTAYIALFKSNFAPLMGILGGGFYLHNFSLPIIRNSKNP